MFKRTVSTFLLYTIIYNKIKLWIHHMRNIISIHPVGTMERSPWTILPLVIHIVVIVISILQLIPFLIAFLVITLLNLLEVNIARDWKGPGVGGKLLVNFYCCYCYRRHYNYVAFNYPVAVLVVGLLIASMNIHVYKYKYIIHINICILFSHLLFFFSLFFFSFLLVTFFFFIIIISHSTFAYTTSNLIFKLFVISPSTN